MNSQKMVNAHITIPADSQKLISDLVQRLGGKMMSDSLPAHNAEQNPGSCGQILKGLRLKAGITQRQTADALGIPQSHISEFESDKRKIPFKHAIKLGSLLNTSSSAFLTPNKDTCAAMAELKAGKGQACTSAQELFQDLGI